MDKATRGKVSKFGALLITDEMLITLSNYNDQELNDRDFTVLENPNSSVLNVLSEDSSIVAESNLPEVQISEEESLGKTI